MKPTHYDLTIRTNLENQIFDGSVDVQCVTDPILSTPSPIYISHSIDVLHDTSELTFNSSDLTLSRPSVYSEALTSFVDVHPSVTFNEQRGRATIKLAKTLPAGSKAKLKIAYEGKLLSNMTGYYKSVWDHDGKKDYYSLTQFEVTSAISHPSFTHLTASPQATHARRAFPCWDEPLLKATFSITMISRANTVNLSNMPVKSEGIYSAGMDSFVDSLASSLAALRIGEVKDQWKITHFEKSPPVRIALISVVPSDTRFRCLLI